MSTRQIHTPPPFHIGSNMLAFLERERARRYQAIREQLAAGQPS